MSVVRIEAHPTTSCESYVVSFANGKLNKDLSHEVSFGCYRHTNTNDPRFSKRRIVVAETADMQYVAKNYGAAEASTAAPSRHFVALVNRARGTMRICETRLLLAKPLASNVDNADVDVADAKDEQEEGSAADAAASTVEKSDRLTSTFGSKRKRRAMESRLKNAIKGAALENAVESAVQKALVESKDAVGALNAVESSELVPPHDKNATDISKTYPLDGIITAAELDAISSYAEPLVNSDAESIAKLRTEGSFCDYILDHVRRLPVKASRRRHKASLLMYLHYMLTMHSWKAVDLKKLDPFLPLEVPEVIQLKLYEAFTVQSGIGKNTTWLMPSRLKDKLAAYIIVLCFIVDEYSFEVAPVQKALAISSQKLANYIRAVGGRIASKRLDTGDMVKVAQLTVPLRFPDGYKRRKTM